MIDEELKQADAEGAAERASERPVHESRPVAPPEASPVEPARSGPTRALLLVLGLCFSALGTEGAFLPVLPTTPFLLRAAACFARSSPRFHARLLGNRMFGPYLTQWQHDRTIPREAKRKAYGLVVLTFGLSIAFVDGGLLRGMLALIGALLVAFLAWLPTTDEG